MSTLKDSDSSASESEPNSPFYEVTRTSLLRSSAVMIQGVLLFLCLILTIRLAAGLVSGFALSQAKAKAEASGILESSSHIPSPLYSGASEKTLKGPQEKAWILYRAAMALTDQSRPLDYSQKDWQSLSSEKIRLILSPVEDALDLIETAAQKDYPIQFSKVRPLSGLSTDLQIIRLLGESLRLRSELALRNDNLPKALRAVRGGLLFTNIVHGEFLLIQAMVRLATIDMALEQLTRILAKKPLSPTQAKEWDVLLAGFSLKEDLQAACQFEVQTGMTLMPGKGHIRGQTTNISTHALSTTLVPWIEWLAQPVSEWSLAAYLKAWAQLYPQTVEGKFSYPSGKFLIHSNNWMVRNFVPEGMKSAMEKTETVEKRIQSIRQNLATPMD